MTLPRRRPVQALRERVRLGAQPIDQFVWQHRPAPRWPVLGRATRLSLIVLVLLIAGVFEPAGARRDPPTTVPAPPQPRLGGPCRLVERYPVSFAMDVGGAWVGSFAFAGGAARGHVELPSTDSRLIADDDAYVADVRVGTYEPIGDAGERGRLTCRVVPTYHFYCPATGIVDQFCLTWIRHRDHGSDSQLRTVGRSYS